MVGSKVELLELIERIDVAKGVGLVVECDLNGLECSVPGIDLSTSALEKPGQMRQHRAANEREHRVGLIEGPRDGELGIHLLQRCEQPRDQIRRQERRVARNGGDQRLCRMREPHVQPGERARETLDRVGNDAKAERRVSIEILVGVDQDVVDLRREPVQHVSHHGSAVKGNQALVDSAHAPALATGEHHAAHSARRRCQASGRNRSPPANSRKRLLVARPIMVMPTFCAIS